MNQSDIELLATVAWKENRRGRIPGMTSIINVVMNRSAKHNKSIEQIIMAPRQFTSMSVPSDPEYSIDPQESVGIDHDAWMDAQDLAAQASQGALHDITNGSTMYFAPAGMPSSAVVPYVLPDGTRTVFPKMWNIMAVRYTCTIAKQLFFVEV
jgi:spore germination cell wall hydrolase CwlJ-like protein